MVRRLVRDCQTTNRPFLRALHGYGLCLGRMGRSADAETVFHRMLSLNPNDNQGVRFCWDDLWRGLAWEEAQGGEGGVELVLSLREMLH